MKKTYADYETVKEWFVEALIKLIDGQPFERITITELCCKAGVNRSTFYRYYNSKDDIFADYFEYLGQICAKHFRDNGIEGEKQALEFFKFYGQYVNYFRALINLHKEYIIFKGIIEGVEENKFEAESVSIYTKYISFILFSILINWIINGCKESIEELSLIYKNTCDTEYLTVSVSGFKAAHNKLK